MLRFAVRRAASALLTLLGVLVLVFGLLAAAPGDPASMAARSGTRAVALSPEALAAFRNLYGLDRPAPERFGLWVLRAASLDFGLSLSDGRPVKLRIAGALPATVTLNLAALLLALAVGVPVGIGAPAPSATRSTRRRRSSWASSSSSSSPAASGGRRSSPTEAASGATCSRS